MARPYNLHSGCPGVTFLDNQEALNRLQIGIEDDTYRASIEKQLVGFGVPIEAVEFKMTGKGQQASLGNLHRPLVGGLRITSEPPGLGPQPCSLGFVGLRGSQAGFVTASHCTGFTYGVVEYTQFNQPVTSRVGEEWVDPMWFTGTGGICDSGDHCRFSEAAWIKCDAGVQCNRGYMANPATFNNPSNWNGLDKYKVTHEMGIAGVGSYVHKVGHTSGETTGFVDNTCIDIDAFNVTFICQHFADFVFNPGDSGSPVFAPYTYPYLGPNVHLHGMVWYYYLDLEGGVFSDVNYIQFTQELGNILTVAP